MTGTTPRLRPVLLALAVLATPPARAADLAVTNVRLHTGPGSAPLERATVIVRGGVIERVGAGLENAVRNGVEVLAHTAPPAGPLGAELVAVMRRNRVALIPTLELWTYELRRAGVPEQGVERALAAGIAQVAEYAGAGGEILFGTDVGYMTDFDTAEELAHLGRAGLGFDAVLAALTTNPARRFAGESGRVEPGAPGELVIYAADPAADLTAFSRVEHTIRGGEVVYSAPR